MDQAKDEARKQAGKQAATRAQKEEATVEDLKPWSKRRFVLTGGLALYFKADKCRGCVYLRGAKIKARRPGEDDDAGFPGTTRSHPYLVLVKSRAPRRPSDKAPRLSPAEPFQAEWVLDCQTHAARDEWVAALTEAAKWTPDSGPAAGAAAAGARPPAAQHGAPAAHFTPGPAAAPPPPVPRWIPGSAAAAPRATLAPRLEKAQAAHAADVEILGAIQELLAGFQQELAEVEAALAQCGG